MVAFPLPCLIDFKGSLTDTDPVTVIKNDCIEIANLLADGLHYLCTVHHIETSVLIHVHHRLIYCFKSPVEICH